MIGDGTERQLDTIAARESVTTTDVLPDGKAEPFGMRQGGGEVAIGQHVVDVLGGGVDQGSLVDDQGMSIRVAGPLPASPSRRTRWPRA
ncbi:hypothetical protein [Pseudofrankia sp. DC12]|uniref:hypothetical protein n=1 Tax=Pseudofrankia sp. DC12 TaxID=683315 RepID=UPI0005F874C3|nr:hypothetical protein [Pseudofrankia sp. DC12]